MSGGGQRGEEEKVVGEKGIIVSTMDDGGGSWFLRVRACVRLTREGMSRTPPLHNRPLFQEACVVLSAAPVLS